MMRVMDEGYDVELDEAVRRGKYMKKDYIKAVMIGHAVGDALGLPVEFFQREKIDENPVVDMRGHGAFDVPAGSWSDDTSMSLAAFDSLAKDELDYFDIMVNFARWLANGEYTPTGEAFDVGRTCLKSIRNFIYATYSEDNGFISPPGYSDTSWGQRGEYANGNGSLMRIHPFVLYAFAKEAPFVEWVEIIKKASALTHAHRRSQIGCIIYAFVLTELLREQSKESIARGLERAKAALCDHPEFIHYGRIFEKGFTDIPRDEINSSGYVVNTLEAALWCLLTTDNYRDCVLKAVNLGRDADTVAAVAGGLAGALYGYEAIPLEWRDALIKRDYIEDMCERAAENWSK